jgi:7-cyano-7-deazaguanine reductase
MTDHGPLGRDVTYVDRYDSTLLHAIPRSEGRASLGLTADLPFRGFDLWNGWEISWLDATERPRVAVMEMRVPAVSPCIVESKSLKLYLNSLNNSVFASRDEVQAVIARDVSERVGMPVEVMLAALDAETSARFGVVLPVGECIDEEPCQPARGEVEPSRLRLAEAGEHVSETLVSHLLRSNCPVTSQPDWASVIIRYSGPRIDRAALLSYIVSYRNHNEFHEQCVERMFVDIKTHCAVQSLSIMARYTRRGGLDINPFRSDEASVPVNTRFVRQ